MKDNKSVCIANSVIAIIVALVFGIISIRSFFVMTSDLFSIADWNGGWYLITEVCLLVIAYHSVKLGISAILTLTSLKSEIKSVKNLTLLTGHMKKIMNTTAIMFIGLSIMAEEFPPFILVFIVLAIITSRYETNIRMKYFNLLCNKLKEVENSNKDESNKN